MTAVKDLIAEIIMPVYLVNRKEQDYQWILNIELKLPVCLN
jgi:hypothetical protein